MYVRGCGREMLADLAPGPADPHAPQGPPCPKDSSPHSFSLQHA